MRRSATSRVRQSLAATVGPLGLSVTACLALLLVTACGPLPVSDPDDDVVPLFELGEPVLEIGVLEGQDEYVFATINNAVRLNDGSYAVADGLSQRISIYDSEGDYVRAWGQEGDGPGEFNNLGGVIPHGPDSLIAVESFRDQLTVFSLEGDLGRTLSGVTLSNDSTYRLDSWLHGRYWVQGAITPAERAGVRQILGHHTPPTVAPGMRVVFVGDDESVWVHESVPGGRIGGHWIRLNQDGTPVAAIRERPQFRPTHFEADRVTGVWLDENDVSFVRSYGWSDAGTKLVLPVWLQGAAPASEGPPELDADAEAEVMEQMRMSIRALASAQEIHYSSAMSYTDDIAVLEDMDLPEGLHVSFTKGDSRGWTAVFAHEGLSRICGLAYGFDMPLGWRGGYMACAPEASPAP